MRAGEIFNLTWEEIDLENELIKIKDSKNKSNRVAYMDEEIKEIFSQKPKGEPAELVSKDRKGGKIKEIGKGFGRAVEALGFNRGVEDPREKVVFHPLRHTFASWLAMEGTPIYTIKELLDHKTLAMTVRCSHLIPDTKNQAIKAISKRLSEATKEKVASLGGAQIEG